MFENDLFAGEDDHYTNGIAIAYLSPASSSLAPKSAIAQLIRIGRSMPMLGGADREGRLSAALVHSMFTPDDITVPNPSRDDQPYAGVAALDLAVHAVGDDLFDALQLRLGWVGPATLAEEIQKEVHEWTDSDRPAGWSTQLPDEPLLNVGWERHLRLGGHPPRRGAGVAASGNVAVHLGNFYTGTSIGILARAGWNLGPAIAVASPRRGVVGRDLPAPSSSSPSRDGEAAAPPPPRWRLAAFVAGEGFAIARYLPLDGTLFKDSRTVDGRKPLVASLSAGLTASAGRWSLAYAFTVFTDTFEGERSENRFGTVTLSIGF